MMEFQYAEGATPLNPEEKDGLKLSHISTQAELDLWEQRNIQEALDWLKKRKNKGNIINEDFLRELHRRMFAKVWKWAGVFRQSEKTIGIEWHRISTEVRNLFNDTQYWIDHQTFSPDEIAYRFHHRLVFIHPFANGNGRHSRLMTDVLLHEVLNRDIFTWGSGANLVKDGDERKRYINALKAADDHNYDQLKEFVRS